MDGKLFIFRVRWDDETGNWEKFTVKDWLILKPPITNRGLRGVAGAHI